MKKLFNLFAVALLFMATSCEKSSDIVSPSEGEEVQFGYSINVNAAGTKAYGANPIVNVVKCEVYEVNNGAVADTPIKTKYLKLNGGTASYAPYLINNQTYQFVFYAFYYDQASLPADDNINYDNTKSAYNVASLKSVTMNSAFVKANSEQLDAFYFTEQVTVNGATSKGAILIRPVAQINIGVTEADFSNAVTLGKTPKQSALTVTTKATAFNAVTGSVINANDDQTITFAKSTLPTGTFAITKNSTTTDYKYLFVGYMFADASSDANQKTVANLQLSVCDENGTEFYNTGNTLLNGVSFKANYKTNIFGTLMTGKVDYTISLGDFSTPDNDVEINN